MMIAAAAAFSISTQVVSSCWMTQKGNALFSQKQNIQLV